jgi:uncharacterized radical SAM superfamily protein
MPPDSLQSWDAVSASDLGSLLDQARDLSWEIHGRRLDCFIPGRMVYMGEQGEYPVVSLTADACALSCDHCSRKILKSMVPAPDPDALKTICRQLDAEGNAGVLLSGGSNGAGALPWGPFLDTIRWVKENTGLKISIHSGIIDTETALQLREAGIDQVLIDVIGSEETIRRVYHLPGGLSAMTASLNAWAATKLPLIPHIIVGLHYGRIEGEMEALEMVAQHPIASLVVVVLNPLRETPMADMPPPAPETVARFIAAARLRMPSVPIALSCGRPSGPHRAETDRLALRAGVNRIAMPAQAALSQAREMGLAITFHKTCCSRIS